MLTRALAQSRSSKRWAGRGFKAGRSNSANKLARQPGRFLKGRWLSFSSSSRMAWLSSARRKNFRCRSAARIQRSATKTPDSILALSRGRCGRAGTTPYAVVLGHFLIDRVEVGFIAAGTAHAAASVIGDEEFADTLHKFEGANMGSNPIFQPLTGRGFGVGVVAGTQRGNKEEGRELRTTPWVEDGDRASSVVDEELLTGLVFLTKHHVQMASPAPVEFAEACVAVTVGMILVIFLPPQLQG